MSKINILDYKPEELRFDEDNDEIVSLFLNESGTVSVVYKSDEFDGDHMLFKCDLDGSSILNEAIVVVPKKPKFVFPPGVGEAVGKAFKTRDGRKAIVIGDERLAGRNPFFPIIISHEGTICRVTELGYFAIGMRLGSDIVDYWEEGE